MTQALDKALYNKHKRHIKSLMPDQTICPYCNAFMFKETKSPYSLVSIDHIKAYSKGGNDELDNLIACCANCNTKKGNNPYAVMFRLDVARHLHDEEFMRLNDYITVSVRIEYLEKIKELVLEQDLNGAVAMSKEAELRTTSKSFFSKLTDALKTVVKPDWIIKEVIVRLKAEKDKMSGLNEETAYIKFTTYKISDVP